MAKKVFTYNLSEPMVSAAAVQFDINAGDGNLTIDGLTGGEAVLASGELQYLETQPTRSVSTSSGQVIFTLKAGGKAQPWFRLPWAACNGATLWQVHINPSVPSTLTAHTDGGNVRIDLTDTAVTEVTADTGGGNIDLLLPDNTAGMTAMVKTGAGNVMVEIGSGFTGSNRITATSGAGDVVVRLPSGMAARITAASGMGKTVLDPRFSKVADKTYQSSGYDSAIDRIEITLKSGAGNVIVKESNAQPELVSR